MGPARQVQQGESDRGDVLPQLAGAYVEALPLQFGEQLGVDEMNLAKVGLRRVFGDAGAMLHGGTGVSIALHAETLQQGDLRRGDFAEPVFAVMANGFYRGALVTHVAIMLLLGRPSSTYRLVSRAATSGRIPCARSGVNRVETRRKQAVSLVGPVGLEPTTYGLKVRSSTN